MRFVVITDDPNTVKLMGPLGDDDIHLLLSEDDSVIRHARKEGWRTKHLKLGDEESVKKLHLSYRDRVLIKLESKTDLKKCLDAVLAVQHDIPITVVSESWTTPEKWAGLIRVVPLSSFCGGIASELEKAAAMRSVAHLRNIFSKADRVLLLLQDDPDPDGIASALALRTILGRNRTTAPIASFGHVTRPENVAMIRDLEIQVLTISEDDLKEYDRIALLDLQPFHSPQIPLKIDAVIDHHPKRTGYEAKFVDIRPRYGATSTIMTQYLTASGTQISQRLATALVYGIKTDTQLLGRDTTPDDVDAFAELYPLSNQATLRKIDRPQIPRDDLVSFAIALQHASIEGEIIYAHLGPLSREDVIPYFADLCLEIEDAQWSVASGIFDGMLIISIRTYGEGASAGETTKKAFEVFGSAGGHRAMAKAVIPLENIPSQYLDHELWIKERFTYALSGREPEPAI